MSNIVFIPGSPALVSELAPADAASKQLLADARSTVHAALATGLSAVHIVCSHDSQWYTLHAGSFAAWGAPQTEVGKGHLLGELIARYVIDGVAQVSEVRAEIAEINPNVLTVVVLDGSAGITARAPLALIETGEDIHQWCLDLLSGHITQKPEEELRAGGIIEPALWLEAAKLSPRNAELVSADASLGIGRFVAKWEV